MKSIDVLDESGGNEMSEQAIRRWGLQSFRRTLCVIGLCGVCVSFAHAQTAASFDYTADADTVIVSMNQVPDGLEDQDPTPRLRVYGDGRVLVHYPHYMKKAGDYSFVLSKEELDALITSMIEKGTVDFDAATVKSDRQRASVAKREANPGVAYYQSSDTLTVIEVNLSTYKAAGSTAVQNDVSKRIEWHGLRTDVKAHPDIDALQRLAEAEAELVELSLHSELELVE